MEESTCHEMVIYVYQRFSSSMLCLFNFLCTFSLVLNMIATLTLNRKNDRLNARNVKKYLRQWFEKCMARYLFRRKKKRIFVGWGQLN